MKFLSKWFISRTDRHFVRYITKNNWFLNLPVTYIFMTMIPSSNTDDSVRLHTTLISRIVSSYLDMVEPWDLFCSWCFRAFSSNVTLLNSSSMLRRNWKIPPKLMCVFTLVTERKIWLYWWKFGETDKIKEHQIHRPTPHNGTELVHCMLGGWMEAVQVGEY